MFKPIEMSPEKIALRILFEEATDGRSAQGALSMLYRRLARTKIAVTDEELENADQPLRPLIDGAEFATL